MRMVCVVEIGDPYTIILRTIMRARPKFYFGMSYLNGEIHDFYKTSWFVEFEALSRMVKVRGSCDKPFKRNSRLKNYFVNALRAQIHDVIEL